jgi:hypothetical protein
MAPSAESGSVDSILVSITSPARKAWPLLTGARLAQLVERRCRIYQSGSVANCGGYQVAFRPEGERYRPTSYIAMRGGKRTGRTPLFRFCNRTRLPLEGVSWASAISNIFGDFAG